MNAPENLPGHIERALLDVTIARLRTLDFGEMEVHDALYRVADAACKVFGLTGAGLMMVDDDGLARFVLATDEPGRLLEEVQEELGHGPCVDCLYLGEVVTTEDVRGDPRWPSVAERLQDEPVGAVLGVPVRLAGGTVGALNVYLDGRHDWDDADVASLSAFGEVMDTILAGAVLVNRHDEIVHQLQTALDRRVTIERAVGLLMGRHGLDAVDAFNRLRHEARSRRRRVIDLAEELLAAHRPAH